MEMGPSENMSGKRFRQLCTNAWQNLTQPNKACTLLFRKVWVSIKFLSAKFGFTPPPERAQNEEKLYKSVENLKIDTFFGGGMQFYGQGFYGRLGVSDLSVGNGAFHIVYNKSRQFPRNIVKLPDNTVGTKIITYRKNIFWGINLCNVIDYIYIMKFSRELICVM